MAGHRELWKSGCAFLEQATRELATRNYADIAIWPEHPGAPDVELNVPGELADFMFTVMKDTQPDGSIRVALQMYRSRYFGIYGSMRADGFFIRPDGQIRWFTEQDTWEVT